MKRSGSTFEAMQGRGSGAAQLTGSDSETIRKVGPVQEEFEARLVPIAAVSAEWAESRTAELPASYPFVRCIGEAFIRVALLPTALNHKFGHLPGLANGGSGGLPLSVLGLVVPLRTHRQVPLCSLWSLGAQGDSNCHHPTLGSTGAP